MAKVIVSYCDLCLVKDVETAASEQDLTINGTHALLDLCEAHVKELVEPLTLILAEHGQNPKRAAKAAGKKPSVHYEPNEAGVYMCEDCGREFTSPQGIGRHRTSHND